MREKGFTLIEVLVTISIIAVIFGIVISSSQAVQKQSRDTQRQTDLRTLQSALQQYYADQGFFPEDKNSTNTFTGSSYKLDLASATKTSVDNCAGNPTASCQVANAASKIYLNRVPKDPLSGNDSYLYHSFTTNKQSCNNLDSTKLCTSYCIYVVMENDVPTKPVGCVVNNGFPEDPQTIPVDYTTDKGYWVTPP